MERNDDDGGWEKFLDKVPVIAEKIAENWKKYYCPRNESDLSFPQEEIEKVVNAWISLRDIGFRPSSACVILKEWYVSSKSLIQVIDEWEKDERSEWFGYRDRSYSGDRRKISEKERFVYDICWCLENFWHVGGYKIKPEKGRVKEGKGRPRKKHPIEKMRKLQKQGLGYGGISKKLGIPKTTVYRMLKEKSFQE